jgi:hypothetical protein
MPLAILRPQEFHMAPAHATEQTVRRFKRGATQGEVIVGTPRQCGFVPGELPGVICRPRGIAVRGGRLLVTMDHAVVMVETLAL